MKKLTAFLLVISFLISIWSIGYAAAAFKFNRINGSDRYVLSANLSSANFKSASNVVIVNGSDGTLVDGFAAIPLAKALNAPLLLVNNNSVSKDVLNEIKRLNPSNIYMIGGINSISNNIENLIGKSSVTYTRIGGNDRYEVAQNIALKLKEIYGTLNKAYICYGGAVSDAALIAGVAAKNDSPVLYVTKNACDYQTQNTVNVLKSAGVKDVDVIGRNGSIPDVVFDDLMYNNGFNANRVDGINREELSASIAQKYFTDPSKVLLINGYKYADGLEADLLSAEGYPVLYVNGDSKSICSGIKNYLKSQTQIKQSNICIIGGTASVSNDAVSNIANVVPQ